MPRLRRAAPLLPLAALLPLAVALACIGAYAGLLGLGRWQADEFTLLINQRNWGWEILPRRLMYAPRPFSEGVLYLYAEAVLAARQPLIVPFLAALWLAVLGTAALAARSVFPPSRLRGPSAVALASALFAFVLVTNDVTEVFYWPMAAAAYLPTAGAAVVLLFLLSGPLDRARRRGAGAALLVAATSSEMGAALAIGFACAAGLDAVARRRMPSRPAWWIVPGVTGLLVMVVIAVQRTRLVELGADAQPYTGQAAAALGLAVRQVALEALGGAGAMTPGALLAALLAKLLFAFAFVQVWRRADPAGAAPCRWHGVLAAAIAGAAFFSAAAAYYHYGALCCERHATTRFWLMDLLAILAVAWGMARWPALRRSLVPSALLALALWPVLLRTDGLWRSYENQPMARSGLARTWRGGLEEEADRMIFYLPPDSEGMLVRGTSQPIRTFPIGTGVPLPGVPLMVTEVGRFFRKVTVVTCHPWQNRSSWLIHGQFIPACPPHDGPPDWTIP